MYSDSPLLQYLHNCNELNKFFTGVIAQSVRVVTVVQTLAQHNWTADNDLRDSRLEEGKLDAYELLDEE